MSETIQEPSNAVSNFEAAVQALQQSRAATQEQAQPEGADQETEVNPEAEPQPERDKQEPEKAKDNGKPKPKPDEDAIALSSQHYALTRRQAAVERRERELEEKIQTRESELTKREQAIQEFNNNVMELGSLDLQQFVQRFAQIRHTTPEAIYKEFADELRSNKPRPSADSPAERRIKQLEDRIEALLTTTKKQTEEERAKQQQAEAEKQVQEWTASVLQQVKASDAYPGLKRLPQKFVATEAQAVAGEYYRIKGVVPDTADLLEYLESQVQAEMETAPEAPAKGRKPGKTITNKDAQDDSSSADLTSLNPWEREQMAIRELKRARASRRE